jgi:8-oxo-dGTP pyrophosphatase MutT (NUDIX family)
MGAGILPTAVYNGQLYFLFGKENKHADTPGFADFGGGTDGDESYLDTAIREFTEETTGFWGSEDEIRQYMGTVGSKYIDFKASSAKNNIYRTYILPIVFTETFVRFYNNNHAFLEKRLPEDVYKSSKLFEKSEVRWFSVNELQKRKRLFRPYYRNIINILIENASKIHQFVSNRINDRSNDLGPSNF